MMPGTYNHPRTSPSGRASRSKTTTSAATPVGSEAFADATLRRGRRRGLDDVADVGMVTVANGAPSLCPSPARRCLAMMSLQQPVEPQLAVT